MNRPPHARSALAAYAAEASRHALLTREGEVALARRIEQSERDVLTALLRCKAGVAEIRRVGEDLATGRLRARDLARSAVEDDPVWEAAERRRLIEAIDATVRLADRGRRARDVVRKDDAPSAAERLRFDYRALEGVARAVLRKLVSKSTQAARAAQAAIVTAFRRATRVRGEMVEANLKLVLVIARRFVNRGVPLPDLVQEGNIGLMRAVDKYDYRLGHKFATYAAFWIRQRISRSIEDHSRLIRVPAHVLDLATRVRRASHKLAHQLTRHASTGEIAAAIDVPPEKVDRAVASLVRPLSLDATVGEPDGSVLGDLLEDQETPSPFEHAGHVSLSSHAHALLSTLTPREQEILRSRFGIGGGPERTLEDLGAALRVTRERVRQIEESALGRLRKRAAARQLVALVES